jgi:hypothetical protein
MKRRLVSLAFLLCVIVLPTSYAFSSKPAPQDGYCQHISYWNGRCKCLEGTTGWCACDESNPYGCHYFGNSCVPGYNECGAFARPDRTNLGRHPLSLDLSTIKQIAAVHPRFALTLNSIAKATIEKPMALDFGQFIWSPFEVKPEYITYFLNPTAVESREFFEKLHPLVQSEMLNLKQENPDALPAISYMYNTDYEPNSKSATLRILNLTQTKYDPLINKIVVHLKLSNHGTTTEWRVKDWAVESIGRSLNDAQDSLKGRLVVDDLTIKQIAAVHPRFALTINSIARSTMNNTDTLKIGQFKWSPFEVKPEHIDYFLNPTAPESKGFFEHLDSVIQDEVLKLKQIDANDNPEIVYPYFTEYVANSNSATLRVFNITPTKYDSPKIFGIFHLEKTSNGSTNEWRIKDWTIN